MTPLMNEVPESTSDEAVPGSTSLFGSDDWSVEIVKPS